MKRNVTLVKALLEHVEKTDRVHGIVPVPYGDFGVAPREVEHHIRLLVNDGFVSGYEEITDGGLVWMRGLTQKGQEYLASLRELK